MTKLRSYIGYIILSLFFTNSVGAQFLNFQISIEPELSATVERELNFGTVITNSGEKYIELGDVDMGIFRIRAYYTQNIFVSFTPPEALRHINPAVDEEIQLDLNIAYNDISRNVRDALKLDDNIGFLSFDSNFNVNTARTSDVWEEIELYVYGSINVGNIPNGIYEGNAILNIDYD